LPWDNVVDVPELLKKIISALDNRRSLFLPPFYYKKDTEMVGQYLNNGTKG